MFLTGIHPDLRCLPWESREIAADRTYDLVINLEDTLNVAQFIRTTKHERIYGAFADKDETLRYTADSSAWFDLSLISLHGRENADRLKLENRRSYQDLVFTGLGFKFSNQPYKLPKAIPTDLKGDVAVAREAGPVWPMKNWAYYDEVIAALRAQGYRVNILGKRASLLEHLADVQNHRCLLGGDSLPMHLALGSKVQCVSLFSCTSPWEIHDYDLQTKLISPLLSEFFYKRTFDPRATTAIPADEVLGAVVSRLRKAA